MPARKLNSFLTEPNSPLSRLTAAAQRLSALARIWESIAPIGLASYCRVGRLDDGILTLYADNGSIASKLNQQLPSLLIQFQQQTQSKSQQRGGEITGIRIDVQVNPPLSKSLTAQKNPISNQGIACLKELELELPESSLKGALTNLIEHQRQLKQGHPTDGDREADDQQ